MLLEKLTAGAQGDSAHEYLLKQYILTGKADQALLEMCKDGGLYSTN